MPRKSRNYKRHKIAADPKYNNVKVAKFINHVMKNGKKSVAQKVVYEAFEYIKEKMKTEPRQIFDAALKNVSPVLEVKSRRIGGANYQVPLEVPVPRGNSLAMRWIRDFARNKKGRAMDIKLADELLAAAKGEGPAIKKRDDTHKMAEANKAFAHLRW